MKKVNSCDSPKKCEVNLKLINQLMDDVCLKCCTTNMIKVLGDIDNGNKN